MKRIVYRELAACIDAMNRCEKWVDEKPQTEREHWFNMRLIHSNRIKRLVSDYLPRGNGIDYGCEFNFVASNGDKLVFDLSFHHMNESGSYDGWTDHTVTVCASLISDIDIKISGKNRNDIKEYLYQVIEPALRTEFDE